MLDVYLTLITALNGPCVMLHEMLVLRYKLPQKRTIPSQLDLKPSKNKTVKHKSTIFLLHYIATCLLTSSCVCRSAFSLLLTVPHVPTELPWGLFISSFVCLFFVHSLCSVAELTRRHFCPGRWCSPIKACDQPEHFNDGCGAGVDRITTRQREKEKWHTVRWWLQHTSVVAQWLHCRQQTG